MASPSPEKVDRTVTAATTAPAPRASKRRTLDLSSYRSQLWFVVIGLVAAALVLPPLVLMIWTSLTPHGTLSAPGALSPDAYREILTSHQFKKIALSTLEFTAGASILALALGSLAAFAAARTNMMGKGFIYACVFMSFAIPGMIEATGWVMLLGSGAGILRGPIEGVFGWAPTAQSMYGIIIVQALSWAPMVFMLLVGPFRAMDASLEESAAVCGASRWKVMFRISGPLMGPSLLAVLILVVVRAIQAFEVPLFLGSSAGIQTFTTEIYSGLKQNIIPDYATAAAFGTILVFVLSIGLFLYYRATKMSSKFTTMTGKAFRSKEIDLGRWRPVSGAIAFLIMLVFIAPVIAMLLTSFWPHINQGHGLGAFSWSNYHAMFGYRNLWTGIKNSLIVALVAATAVTLLCMFASFITVRSKAKGRQVLDHLFSIPMVVPGTVLGLAFLVTYLRVPIPIYGTLWILILAFVVAYSPYGMRYLQPALVQISPDLDDSSRVAGAGEVTVFRRILLPLMTPAVLGSWLYVFFHSFRDVSIASMIYSASTPVVATMLLDMWQDGTPGVLSAFGSLISIASILVGAVAFGLSRRFGFQL